MGKKKKSPTVVLFYKLRADGGLHWLLLPQFPQNIPSATRISTTSSQFSHHRHHHQWWRDTSSRRPHDIWSPVNYASKAKWIAYPITPILTILSDRRQAPAMAQRFYFSNSDQSRSKFKSLAVDMVFLVSRRPQAKWLNPLRIKIFQSIVRCFKKWAKQ